MGDRVILHCDLNCFFASVELLSHPELRDIPVAVCGDPASRHGIILAKNEPAKRLGVQTAETIWQAKQKCPGPGAAAAPPRPVPGVLPTGQRHLRAVHRSGGALRHRRELAGHHRQHAPVRRRPQGHCRRTCASGCGRSWG